MDRIIYAIIVAGGSGSRMGAAVPKQFLELEGKAILHISIETIASACPGAKFITVLPEDSIDYWKEYCAARNFSVPQLIVKGGITRFHSVRNALEKVPDGALVLVHDGVRPLVSGNLVRRLVEAAAASGSAVPVIPVIDTLIALKRKEDAFEELHQAIDRTNAFGCQTPQVFYSEDLREAYVQAYETSFTDDSSVMRKNGKPLTYVEGERFNIKITTPDDYLLAEAILRLQE